MTIKRCLTIFAGLGLGLCLRAGFAQQPESNAERQESGKAPPAMCDVYAWALFLKLSAERHAELCRLVDAQGDALLGADDARDLRASLPQMFAQANDGRTLSREIVRITLLDAARKSPSLELARWVNRYYYKGHHRLAQGAFSLSQHETDAAMRLAEFAWAKQAAVHPDQPLPPLASREARLMGLVQAFPSMGEKAQRAFFEMPKLEAEVRGAWPQMSAQQRDEVLKSLVSPFLGLPGFVASAGSPPAAPAATPQAESTPSGPNHFSGLEVAPSGPVLRHGPLSFQAPAGWSVATAPDGATVLTGHLPPNQGPCEIRVLDPASGATDLTQAALALIGPIQAKAVQRETARHKPYDGPLRTPPNTFASTREEGESSMGWKYVDMEGELTWDGVLVRVLVISSREGTIPVIAFTRFPACLGGKYVREHDTWETFFHSLRVDGYVHENDHLAREIVGTWSAAGGHGGVSETYSPNGRMGNVAVAQTYEIAGTPAMVWEVNRGWQGDGPYEVHGSRLHIENSHAGPSEHNVTRLFRIVHRPRKDGPPGAMEDALMVLTKSDTQVFGFSPANVYVSTLVRQGAAPERNAR